ncbi:hypothetical protein CR155_12175 [Pollutimonas nitritireducens]|uniref:Lipoprotein n=1 Tax=Pollutimonas nitritireducens TaxID=2045209 RepID=A0A2N4UEY9_9BURK|nr:hypothetical protein [Pollutimonas nitritireducens]PLC53577.1 hypothetical protein CR155_12175 [Pollutimonas nitritireducens]
MQSLLYKNLAIFAVVVSVSGCATWTTGNVAQNDRQRAVSHEKTPPASIVLTEGDITDRQYTSIGDISVTVNKTTVFHANPTKKLVNEKLKEKAAGLGADAVILVRYGEGGISFMSWGSLEGKGRAIKFAP